MLPVLIRSSECRWKHSALLKSNNIYVKVVWIVFNCRYRAMADGQRTVECGFCLRKNEALEQPKVLPCTHVHCLGCLTAYYDINHVVQCPLSACR